MFAQESVMEIQNEKEAFERFKAKQIGIDYETLKKDLDDCEKRFPNNRYAGWNFKSDWELWQAATAQAVPEGFVVLKISDVREILSNASDAMDAESPSSVFTQTGIPSTWYDHHLVAEKNILDAIKAQEPTND